MESKIFGKTNVIWGSTDKMSFGKEKPSQDFDTILNAIIKAKPSGTKGV